MKQIGITRAFFLLMLTSSTAYAADVSDPDLLEALHPHYAYLITAGGDHDRLRMTAMQKAAIAEIDRVCDEERMRAISNMAARKLDADSAHRAAFTLAEQLDQRSRLKAVIELLNSQQKEQLMQICLAARFNRDPAAVLLLQYVRDRIKITADQARQIEAIAAKSEEQLRRDFLGTEVIVRQIKGNSPESLAKATDTMAQWNLRRKGATEALQTEVLKVLVNEQADSFAILRGESRVAASGGR